MANKKFIRKTNKPLNIYSDGGGFKSFNDFMNSDTAKGIKQGISAFNGMSSASKGNTNFLAMNQVSGGAQYGGKIAEAVDTTAQMLSGIDQLLTKKRKPLEQTIGLVPSYNRYATGGDITQAITTGTALIGNAINQAQITDTSGIKNQVKNYGNVQLGANSLDDLMNSWSSRNELQHVKSKDLRNKSWFGDIADSFAASGQGAAAGSAFGPWGTAIGGIVGGVSSLTGSIVGRVRANKAKGRLNKQIDIANSRNLQAYNDKALNLDTQNDMNIFSNFHAFGGPLYGSGALGYSLANKDLDIQAFNAYNKSKFTSMPNSFSSLNTFAEGGNINNPMDTLGGNLGVNGADWNNGPTIIGNGGTHEQNPREGVQMGTDPQGIPNLVEQGEAIFDNYVYSNRMVANKKLLKAYNLPEKYDNHSFASIAEDLSKESKERPNDPISKNGLVSSLTKLKEAQESLREQTQPTPEGMQFAYGGRFGNLFEGPGYGSQQFDEDWFTKNKLSTLNTDVNYQNYLNSKPTYSDILGSLSTNVDKDNNSKRFNETDLRYAPVLGSALGVIHDLANKPDYSSANAILEAANKAGEFMPVEYSPIGNYLQYTPFDRNYYINKLNAQSNATRNALMNSSSPSRNASILAADYNAINSLGELARKAEEYNQQQRQNVETFNRTTNQANTEMGLKAAMANQSAMAAARNAKLNGIASAMKMKEDIANARSASISANLTNFFDNLGNVGKEAYAANMINSNPANYYRINRDGKITYKNGFEKLPKAYQDVIKAAAKDEAASKKDN